MNGSSGYKFKHGYNFDKILLLSFSCQSSKLKSLPGADWNKYGSIPWEIGNVTNSILTPA